MVNIGYRSRAHIRTVREEAWLADAECARARLAHLTPREAADVFFPESPGNSSLPEIYDRARAICARCPVRAECLDYATRERIEQGMFGGLTPTERLLADERIPHGTLKGWAHGCRCADCHSLKAEYDRKQGVKRRGAA